MPAQPIPPRSREPDRDPKRGTADLPAVGYTEGVFDLFHIGHLDLLQTAAARCQRLVVGVLDDELAQAVAGLRPYVPADERRAVVEAVRGVAAVIAVTDDDLATVARHTGFDVVFRHGGPLAATPPRLSTLTGYAAQDLPPARRTSSTVLQTALTRHLAATAEL